MERAVERDVECTHCHVVMATWTAPGSTVRYWQCHLCRRTFSSLYRDALWQPARPRAAPPSPAGSAAAAPGTEEEARWSQLKRRAASWFERLDREARIAPAGPRRLSVEAVASAAARGR